MVRYVVRRVLLIIPIVWAALTLLFIVYRVVPNDPVQIYAGAGRVVNPIIRENVERKYGLDKSPQAQYWDFLTGVNPIHFCGDDKPGVQPGVGAACLRLHSDLGESYSEDRPVNSIVRETLPNSVRLATWAIIIEVAVGLAVGILAAVRRYSFADAFATVTTTAIVALPVFVLGVLLQWIFGILPHKGTLPSWMRLEVQGMPEDWDFFFIPDGDGWRFVILPAVVLAAGSTALLARMTRTTMLEVLRADFVRTAIAKGLRRRQVVVKHALRNAMIPIVTLIGIDFATLVGAAVITETIFNWNGIGLALVDGVSKRDAPVVQGLTIVLVALYAFVNLLVDISYTLFDPRVRLGKRSES